MLQNLLECSLCLLSSSSLFLFCFSIPSLPPNHRLHVTSHSIHYITVIEGILFLAFG